MRKLNWEFDGDDEIMWYNGYRIRAVRDECCENPFDDWDCNWPMQVYYDRGVTTYDKSKGPSINDPLAFFTDHALVHDQIAIAKIFDTTIQNLVNDYNHDYDEDVDGPANYIFDAELLREGFEHMLGDLDRRERMAAVEALYNLCGIPAYSETSTGYSQGDWAELLVVALPTAQQEFMGSSITLSPLFAAHVHTYWMRKLESTADLWSAWAWGDVYGYIIEYAVYDEDGEIEDWVEIEDGSCWGYYGADHNKSGLEECALAAVPAEPAPGVPDPETVGLSNNLLEGAA